jgi:hypothetical protein
MPKLTDVLPKRCVASAQHPPCPYLRRHVEVVVVLKVRLRETDGLFVAALLFEHLGDQHARRMVYGKQYSTVQRGRISRR